MAEKWETICKDMSMSSIDRVAKNIETEIHMNDDYCWYYINVAKYTASPE